MNEQVDFLVESMYARQGGNRAQRRAAQRSGAKRKARKQVLDNLTALAVAAESGDVIAHHKVLDKGTKLRKKEHPDEVREDIFGMTDVL